jgi:hypothetical protein
MVPFSFNNLSELSHWLKQQADKSNRKITTLARNKSDRQFYVGQKMAFVMLSEMIDSGELVIIDPHAEDRCEGKY